VLINVLAVRVVSPVYEFRPLVKHESSTLEHRRGHISIMEFAMK
jgi:hypothetical protein